MILKKYGEKKIRFDVLTEVAASSNNLDSIQAHITSLIAYNKGIAIQNEMCKISAQLIRKALLPKRCTRFFVLTSTHIPITLVLTVSQILFPHYPKKDYHWDFW